MSDVVLSAILVSVVDEEDIEAVKLISQNNSLFGIDLKKTIQDKEKLRIPEKDKSESQTETQTETQSESQSETENNDESVQENQVSETEQETKSDIE
jgi:selenophosphate synthetase-related protein